MEKKKKRIKISQIDKYTALYGKFGWQEAGTEKPKRDSTVVLLLERDKKQIGKNYNKVKGLEKDYEGMRKVSPKVAIVMAVIGGAALGAYFFTKDTFFLYILFLYASLACFSIAAFALVIFIILLFAKPIVIKSVLQKAGVLSGAVKQYPLTQNILKENPDCWTIRKSFGKSYPLAKRK